VTIHEVLIQYEDSVHQLHAGIEQIRLPHALATGNPLKGMKPELDYAV
jgi:hypothetical protein